MVRPVVEDVGNARVARVTDDVLADLRPLSALRKRLALWYLLTFGTTLVLLAGALFVVIRRQISRELDVSLTAAVHELVRAAHIREIERASVHGPLIDAVDELRIPDRQLFLLDPSGKPVRPDSAPEWVRSAARHAARTGSVNDEYESGERTFRVHAERFRLTAGDSVRVAVAVADDVELEDRYASMIAAFGGLALAALLLVAAGGSFLARKSTIPVERAVAHMRRFMADAAHELRAPLTVVRTRADVALQRERTGPEYQSTLRAIQRETEELGEIVGNLLILARADTGELPLHRERVYLDDVALDATRAAHALAQNRGVQLSIAEFEEAAVQGDRGLLRQLVMILLDNGIKFTPSGGTVNVRVSLAAHRPRLEVSDTGAGIAPAHLPHVFERFFRGDPARARGEGAGLGLSIARWIAEQHQATIDVLSNEGNGTRVVVVFPEIDAAIA
jgi:signal transduction histidine kinase